MFKNKKLKQYEKSLKIANEVLQTQGCDGNYNYDSYMLGVYNGMEYIIALFEQREPKFIDGHEIEFLSDKDKEIARLKTAKKKVIEKIESVRVFGLRSGKTFIASLLNDILDILEEE